MSSCNEDVASALVTEDVASALVTEDFRCAKCKCLPSDAFMVPCGCRLCRACLDGLVDSGSTFCPGATAECGEAQLSLSVTDYRANRKIAKLASKCPNEGCAHTCRLADMQEHLSVCPRRSAPCPFGALGCKEAHLFATEVEAHLRQEERGHSELLVAMVVDMRSELERVQRDLELKERQIREQAVQNKSILAENAQLAERVRMLAQEIDKEGTHTHKGVVMETGVLDEFVQIQLQHLQTLLGHADTSYEWRIDQGLRKTSGCFTGEVHPYRFQLAAQWSRMGSKSGVQIHLRVYAGEHDALLLWPFLATVTISVADTDKPKASRSVTQKCEIERPPENRYEYSKPFGFWRKSLLEAGINPDNGLCVSCSVFPGWSPLHARLQGTD